MRKLVLVFLAALLLLAAVSTGVEVTKTMPTQWLADDPDTAVFTPANGGHVILATIYYPSTAGWFKVGYANAADDTSWTPMISGGSFNAIGLIDTIFVKGITDTVHVKGCQ